MDPSDLLTVAAARFKALAHPARLRILAMLRGGELCACQIIAVLGLANSTVSAHLAELRRAGFVTERKEGRWVHYRLNRNRESPVTPGRLWKQIDHDPQITRDAAILKRLRSIPVQQLCQADLNLKQLGIDRELRTTR